MAIDVIYETHSTSEDNERGVASGWAHSCLSATGRKQARALGDRRRETAEIAFAGSSIPVLLDWRLRECGGSW